jgi:hypothetical protein
MSSQSVRNEITVEIRRVITDVKRMAIAEGKKKIIELKDKLLNPDQIIKMLTADINGDSCSVGGKNKMKEKAEELKKILEDIESIANKGLEAMTSLETKIGAISAKAKIEMPPIPGVPPIPNPIEKIQTITKSLEIPMKILSYVIRFAPGILASQVAVPGGGSSSGLVIANTTNNVNMAKAKIAEFTNLFTALPRVLDSYIAKADIVFDVITKIKSQIQMIVDEIKKLKAFIIYLELDFLKKCSDFEAIDSDNDGNIDSGGELPYPLGPITLADVIAQTEELYGNMLESLIAQGQSKAIQRIYVLGAQFQRIKNTTVRVINI